MMGFWQCRKHTSEFNFPLEQKRVQKGLVQKEFGSKLEIADFIWWSIFLIFSTNFGKIGVILNSESMYNLYNVIRFLFEKVHQPLFNLNESSGTEFTRKNLKLGV